MNLGSAEVVQPLTHLWKWFEYQFTELLLTYGRNRLRSLIQSPCFHSLSQVGTSGGCRLYLTWPFQDTVQWGNTRVSVPWRLLVCSNLFIILAMMDFFLLTVFQVKKSQSLGNGWNTLNFQKTWSENLSFLHLSFNIILILAWPQVRLIAVIT